ncbi:MAG: TetR family transcriptional regulator [Actinomycetota bacterium]|nr:TetR family transcriptional regulator [Actinomycetota bacterium]
MPAASRPDGRTEHKAETRRALIDAALGLFATKGYEATATDEIAAAAGVSPRTFFRYFETKDQVLFFGGDAFNQAVIRELPAQPIELDDFSALAATVHALAPIVEPLKQRIGLYFKAVDASTVLLGQHAQSVREHDAALAAALARRRRLRRPDTECVLAARLSTLALDHTYRTWLTSKQPLSDVMAGSYALVRRVATPDV